MMMMMMMMDEPEKQKKKPAYATFLEAQEPMLTGGWVTVSLSLALIWVYHST
jgi:hypothetical protein